MLVAEMLAKISRFFKAEVVNNSQVIKVHNSGIVEFLHHMFEVEELPIVEGYDYVTGEQCTFISPKMTNLVDAVFMASKLGKCYIQEVPNDCRKPKILVLNGDFLYLSSGFEYRANSPFIPSVQDYVSEWYLRG